MPYVKLLVTILVITVVVLIAVSLLTFISGIKPHKFVSNITPSEFNLRYESIKLVTEDSIKLDSWYVPAANETKKTIIVLHGYPFDKGNVLPAVVFLHEEFNLLLFDFRYLGRSGGRYSSVGYHEQKDVKAAADYLRGKNQTKTGVFGFSLGGAVAIMSAKQSRMQAVVADSSYATLENMLHESYKQFGIFRAAFTTTTKILSKLVLNINIADVSPKKSIKELDAPILIIHGTADDQIPVANAYQLQKANPNAEIWIVEGANHGSANNIADEEYEKRVLKFFKENLR